MSNAINGLGTPGAAFGSTPAGQTPPATGTGSTSGTSGATPSGNSAQSLAGTDTFLKLLVAQLRNQDPTSPMDNQAFVTELAQFNTVEQMINLKDQITTQVRAQQATEGVALLNKTVTYTVRGVTGKSQGTQQGQVQGVSLAGGNIELRIGMQQVALSDVTEVDG